MKLLFQKRTKWQGYNIMFSYIPLQAALMASVAHYGILLGNKTSYCSETVSGTHLELSPQDQTCRRGYPWTAPQLWPHPSPDCSARSECSGHCWCGWACWGRDTRVSLIRHPDRGWAGCMCICSFWDLCHCSAKWCSAQDFHPQRKGNTSGAAAQPLSGRWFWLKLLRYNIWEFSNGRDVGDLWKC